MASATPIDARVQEMAAVIGRAIPGAEVRQVSEGEA